MAREAASPPARGRGLKLADFVNGFKDNKVAPRTGAWIETQGFWQSLATFPCRPPHGGVD